MKQIKLILFLIISGIFFLQSSCTPKNSETGTSKYKNSQESSFYGNNEIETTKHDGFQILELYGCEYIWSYPHNGSNLVHKGNCKYCNNNKKDDYN